MLIPGIRRSTVQAMAGILAAALFAVAFAQDTAAVALQTAIRKEVVDGDLQAAIRQYEAIAAGGNRAAALQALQRMARCYERLGDAPAAIKTYERLVSRFADQKEAVRSARNRLDALADASAGSPLGWYNGDWQSGIPGLANWYQSKQAYSRVYDDFVVPAGGWIVISVFSNNRMDFDRVTQASWEIRSGMSEGSLGNLVASGIGAADQTIIPQMGPFPNDPKIGYRIQVDDLRVSLPPGRYWLSVAPVGKGESFISATRGRGAVGSPPGNNGLAYFDQSGAMLPMPVSTESVGSSGQFGIGKDFSQGIQILNQSK